MAEYIEQLKQVELAISLSTGETREELISLKKSIKELLDLSDNADSHSNNNTNKNSLTDEYALFMAEMDTKGVLLKKSESSPSLNEISDVIQNNSHISLQESFGEGKKCRAPHRHQWGDVVYHNALISSVISDHTGNQAKILFTNPTHQEMLPCPFLFNDSDCKFSDEKCRFSHGEMVSLSSLQEYVEPDFELLTIGSRVLAKKKSNLWHCAIIKALHEDKCLVKFESDRQEIELQLENVFPLFGNGQNESSSDYSDSENEIDNENVINMSLLNNVSDQVLGKWEKHTKGIGSKLMQKMGYVIGTGLGKRSDGILNPVTAVILPSGKSLDHCMQLREIAGGDKNLFSVERRMKHLKKKQELQRKKSYEREKSKTDVFNFMNNSLLDNQGPDTKRTNTKLTKSQHRLKIKRESCRNLNVVSMKIDEDIRKVERELFVIKESLSRHKDVNSQMHKSLKGKLGSKETELTSLKVQAQNIKLEQNLRNDKKKLTVF